MTNWPFYLSFARPGISVVTPKFKSLIRGEYFKWKRWDCLHRDDGGHKDGKILWYYMTNMNTKKHIKKLLIVGNITHIPKSMQQKHQNLKKLV